MKSSALCFSGFKARVVLMLATACVLSLQVQSHQVYRIVGPDGKLTFSDRPPVASSIDPAQ